MNEDENSLLMAHLRAIHSAIVGLALAVITAGLIIQGDPLEFPLLIVTIFVCLFSFVFPLVNR